MKQYLSSDDIQIYFLQVTEIYTQLSVKSPQMTFFNSVDDSFWYCLALDSSSLMHFKSN